MRRRYLIEAAVALAVLTLLLMVSVPRFYRAQTSARAAQALKDLASIAQAMETYNLASDSVMVHTVISPGSATPYLEANHRTVRPIQSRLLDEISNFTIPPEGLHDIAKRTPPPRYYMDENRDSESMYITLLNYEITDQHAVFSINDLIPPLSSASRFFQESLTKQNEYAGIYYGPCFRTETFCQYMTINKMTGFSQFSLLEPKPYVLYDPTNGAVSHGYTVYRSQPSQAVKQLVPKFENGIPDYPKYKSNRSHWNGSYIAFGRLTQNNNIHEALNAFKSQLHTDSDHEFAEYIDDHLKWFLFCNNCDFHQVRAQLDLKKTEDYVAYIQFQKKIWPFEWQPKFPVQTIQSAPFTPTLMRTITTNGLLIEE